MPGLRIAVAAWASLKNRRTMSALRDISSRSTFTGHAVAEPLVAADVDLAHSALADQLDDAVVAELRPQEPAGPRLVARPGPAVVHHLRPKVHRGAGGVKRPADEPSPRRARVAAHGASSCC